MPTVSKATVIDALRRTNTTIPDAYYLGTIDHESDFNPYTVSDGGKSLGLYQVNASEAAEAGESGNLFDVDVNTRVMVYLAERNRAAIRNLIGLSSNVLDPWDMGAYLSIAHNQGLGAALETIREYGMDWAAYKDRNKNIVKPGFNGPAIVRYGDDVLYTIEVLSDGTVVAGKTGVSHGQFLLLAGLGALAGSAAILAMR